jgi:hypothetical protein
MADQVPLVDLAPYYIAQSKHQEAQRAIHAVHIAASTWGFFVVTGTKVPPQVQSSLLSSSRTFFDLPLDIKNSLESSLHSDLESPLVWQALRKVFMRGLVSHTFTPWRLFSQIGLKHIEIWSSITISIPFLSREIGLVHALFFGMTYLHSIDYVISQRFFLVACTGRCVGHTTILCKNYQ